MALDALPSRYCRSVSLSVIVTPRNRLATPSQVRINRTHTRRTTGSSDGENYYEANHHPYRISPPISELPSQQFHGVISEGPDIVRARERIVLGCGRILQFFTAIGYESYLQNTPLKR